MNKHWLFVLLVAIMLSWAVMATISVCAATPAEINTAIDRSLTQLQARDYTAARATLDTLPAPPTPNALLLAARGTVELASNDIVAAEPLFRTSLSANPRQLSALWGLSLCLLQQRRLYETAPLLDRATTLAPDDAHVKALHAYVYLSLGMTSDAAVAGKAALDGGVRAPFLMATLALVHANMHLPDKAVDFGDMAAQSFHVADLVTPSAGDYLSLEEAAADTPAKLSSMNGPLPTDTTPLPMPPIDETTAAALTILAPPDNSTLLGIQSLQVRCVGVPHLLAFFIDTTLCGATTHAPFRFQWNAAAISPGAHHLTVRAYDTYGMPTAEATIAITANGGANPVPYQADEPTRRMEKRMMAATFPLPSPLSLFTNLCMWNMALKDNVRSIDMLEIAVALNPTNINLVSTLLRMYQEADVPSSISSDIVRTAPATKKEVALTFDSDLQPATIPAILSALAQNATHATFFLSGTSLQQNPVLAQDLPANGQEVGICGYHRLDMAKLPPADIQREVLWNRALMKEVLGQDTHLFRAVDEKPTDALAGQLQRLHFRLIHWSIEVNDDKTKTPTEQVARIIASATNGSILRMPADPTRLLPALLTGLHQRGYACVTVSALLK